MRIAGASRHTRWWATDVSYLSSHAPELIFGLGQEQQADQVHMTWADGRVSTFSDIPAGKFVVNWTQGDRESFFGP